LELGSAAKLDTEDEATPNSGTDDRGEDHDGGDRVPDLTATDEVEGAGSRVQVIAELGKTGH
jgi:hypothetical protein